MSSVPSSGDPRVQPLQEIDRFFAAPRGRAAGPIDAQSAAIGRLFRACERVRPHLASVEALERFIAEQREPCLIRRRISVALALAEQQDDLRYGSVGRRELEAFRVLARNQPAAVIWVFS